jgi:hypothetical protein
MGGGDRTSRFHAASYPVLMVSARRSPDQKRAELARYAAKNANNVLIFIHALGGFFETDSLQEVVEAGGDASIEAVELRAAGIVCARSLFPETGDTIITEEVRKFPSGK